MSHPLIVDLDIYGQNSLFENVSTMVSYQHRGSKGDFFRLWSRGDEGRMLSHGEAGGLEGRGGWQPGKQMRLVNPAGLDGPKRDGTRLYASGATKKGFVRDPCSDEGFLLFW